MSVGRSLIQVVRPMTYLLLMCYQLTPEFDREFPPLLTVPYAEVGGSEGWFQLLRARSEAGSSQGWLGLIHLAFCSRRVGGLAPRAVGPVFHYHFLSTGRSPDSCCGFGPGYEYGVASDGAGSTDEPIKHRQS